MSKRKKFVFRLGGSDTKTVKKGMVGRDNLRLTRSQKNVFKDLSMKSGIVGEDEGDLGSVRIRLFREEV